MTAMHGGDSWYTDAPFVRAESFITPLDTHTRTHTLHKQFQCIVRVLWRESMVIFFQGLKAPSTFRFVINVLSIQKIHNQLYSQLEKMCGLYKFHATILYIFTHRC